MYRYETHLHTSPVSKCARKSVRENVEFYKSAGYAGIFITNHFIDSNINIERTATYEERIEYYFSDYEEGARIGRELDFPVFCGIEMSYGGTDFLVYGLDKAWFLAHPEIEELQKTDELALMMEAGALIIQAHPFREASYINHIRLFPRHVHGVEIHNANRTEFENEMAAQYAKNYALLPFAGSDNHVGGDQKKFGGMESETPIKDEADFVSRVKGGQMRVFMHKIEE
jgi:predicted metal-dependent phosphoesterase TrpH